MAATRKSNEPAFPWAKYVFGIDPGLHGAYALIDVGDDHHPPHTDIVPEFTGPTPIIKGEKGNVYNMQGIATLMNKLSVEYGDVLVIIERQQAMPQQGVKSMFQIGVGYGMWLGIIAANGFRYVDVQAKVWQKSLAGMNCADDTKLRSIRRVQQYFPKFNLVQPGCRTPHDGVADAINIAHYAVMRVLS